MLITISTIAAGQLNKSPTDADIERVRRSQPTITDKDVDAARARHRMPTEAELSRVPVPRMPNVDALPKPAAQAPVDLGAIAKGYDSIVAGAAAVPASAPALIIFVSFSMPDATLTRLVDQAARAGASIAIRGFVDGSLKATVARIRRLIGERAVSIQIDPQAFDRFAVTKTPTFVLARDLASSRDCSGTSCMPSGSFVATSGDVSLDYALEFMHRNAPAFAKDADAFRKRLKG